MKKKQGKIQRKGCNCPPNNPVCMCGVDDDVEKHLEVMGDIRI